MLILDLDKENERLLASSSWQQGSKDADEGKFPRHPHNYEYMRGWLFNLGKSTGAANQLPCVEDAFYLDGYELAQQERQQRSTAPDVRKLVAM